MRQGTRITLCGASSHYPEKTVNQPPMAGRHLSVFTGTERGVAEHIDMSACLVTGHIGKPTAQEHHLQEVERGQHLQESRPFVGSLAPVLESSDARTQSPMHTPSSTHHYISSTHRSITVHYHRLQCWNPVTIIGSLSHAPLDHPEPYTSDLQSPQPSSPLLDRWQEALLRHPDRVFAQYISTGIRHGFRIGFNRESTVPLSTMPSTLQHPQPVREHLVTELQTRQILGVGKEVQGLVVSHFGLIPKRVQKDKWRLIQDLSRPDGRSINDGIDRDLCSLIYVTVDMAVEQIIKLGRGTLMAKVDVKHAYRNVPIHPED